MLTKICDGLYLEVENIISVIEDVCRGVGVIQFKDKDGGFNITMAQLRYLVDYIDKQEVIAKIESDKVKKGNEQIKALLDQHYNSICDRNRSSLSSLNPEDASAMRLKGIE